MKRMGEAVLKQPELTAYISVEISRGPNKTELWADLIAKLIVPSRSFKTVLSPLSYCVLDLH